MFTQPCFIRRNTPELRKKLEELGYKFSGADHIELDCIVTFPHHDAFSVFAAYHFNIYDDSFKIVWKEYIDCGTNEELFLALAALRDDNDYMQWFMIPHTKTVPIPRYCGQQGMNGYQRIITSVEYHKYDRKDNRVSELIKFEKENGETILPRKLNIDELKLWFNYKIMHNDYKNDPNIKYYTNNIRK